MASLENLIRRTKGAAINELVLKRVLLSVHNDIEKRIFVSGHDAKGSRIGVYSEAYQKTRRREGYPPSRKVILQATNQMVNDWTLVNLGDHFGSGFNNSLNFDKSLWVEDTYDYQKDGIFGMTKKEEASISVKMEKELSKLLNKL